MKISDEAVRAAEAMCNYCLTRFPTDTPPHPMLDRPWFAEKVQQAIDEATADLLAAFDVMVNASKDCWDHWDNDRDSKVGKLLAAMSGGLPKYRAELDKAHAAIAKARS